MAYPSLSPLVEQGLLDEILDNLGFIHANDHCRRNCTHCPAFGDTSPVQMTPFATLTRLVRDVGEAFRDRGISPKRSIVSWRISDPLDYHVRDGETTRNTFDVARIWREHLGQGLYLVTNGSEGKRFARTALRQIAARPDVLSQAKLTITPCDQGWGSERYLQNIADDISVLAPLWDLGSTRMEDPDGLRFRINLKSTADRREEALEFMARAMDLAGLDAGAAQKALADPRRISAKDIYDLGSYVGDSPVVNAISIKGEGGKRFKDTAETRSHHQYGIYPDGAVRVIDMYEFKVYEATGEGGAPLRVDLRAA
ncbi:hypothetical protein ACFZBM_27160 [Streptomyces lavendulae]|uniref:Uncharacterized protein n=1 Tax=Streptomyces lavendulae subsp. lavendulae TaxID=58340 RepID=A0A2K8PAB9_STRLA|nr:hypothetical protein [Streptomyces lavendulae]ATZ23679.1 hypothetical protein SLAV_09050 [Streptomyces lavendulae subsp. lavendulae]QUQ53511.1 hypothetical protein SLLC_07080 [Streptomyces lavendulae subsp. lavendulae]